MRAINRILVHHSASSLDTTAAQIAMWHAARFRFGIGYARVIESDGACYDGRKLQRQGAHCKGFNTDSIGICVVGNNCMMGNHWTVDQESTLIETLLYFHRLFPNALTCGHNDLANTKCPGLDIAEWCRERELGIPLFERIAV